MAKEPVAGRSKTRLTPPCTPEQAAQLAGAALADTLESVASTRAARHVLVLDGAPGPWTPESIEVVEQDTGPLARRLTRAFDRLGGATLMIGADTPQLTTDRLDATLEALTAPGVDAVIGPATDGGFWTIGLSCPQPDVFTGIPMSTPRTGGIQRDRLVQCGLRVVDLPEARDVDTIADARAVAAERPDSRFAELLHQFELVAAGQLENAPTRR